MDLSHHYILLDGKPKTLQIDSIERNGTKGYRVRFKNSVKVYNYGYNKVKWLSNPERVDPLHCKVFISHSLQRNVRSICKFACGYNCYWRFVYANGYVLDVDGSRVTIVNSCLDEKASSDTFAYLKNIAAINPLGKGEDCDGILSDMYGQLDFVDTDSAAACYLNPVKHRPKNMTPPDLIFPFGCNASQKKAVAAAFERQMSTIQGPPGTGKTQTILNIIANIVCQGKTVLVVSNNNSATANVHEKLKKYGFGFIVAPLGSKANKEAFIASQPLPPSELSAWGLPASDFSNKRQRLRAVLQQIDKVHALQRERAELQQAHQDIALEWKHFCIDNNLDESMKAKSRMDSKRIISLWLEYQARGNGEKPEPSNWLLKCAEKIKLWWMKWVCRHRLHIESPFDKDDITQLVKELQTLYYLNRIEEISQLISSVDKNLGSYDANRLTATLTGLSMSLFKAALHNRYTRIKRTAFANTKDMRNHASEFVRQYPVVLSTTFSARSCIFADRPYDYVIIDEASQVSADTGFLALTCAYNSVVVGDTLQLPNVVTDEDRVRLNAINEQFQIPMGYDCASNSFLQSVMAVVNDAPITLLREHYRCHPRIINFCNQKFYGGSLLIMTEDRGEKNVLEAVRTVKGNHAVNHFNQREIDVIKTEVLPPMNGYESIGIVTPYNNQADAFNRQIGTVPAGTVHKYQGREEDAIIMSVVDNQISDFADDANLLNVAVSRAKKKFCLVMTGNDQNKNGNIMDLLNYIAYNNCSVTESKLASIFDYLYEQYTEQRMAFIEANPHISEYASENLTYAMLTDVITSASQFKVFKVLCHVPLRQVVKDTSIMSEDELKYASNYNTHIDFLIINKVSKLPVLAIETDGYTFHNEETDQHQRDLMKNHILASYGLPLLRLSTKGSGEKERIISLLKELT